MKPEEEEEIAKHLADWIREEIDKQIITDILEMTKNGTLQQELDKIKEDYRKKKR